MAMADIYLRHRKDKASYVRCYIDLVVRAGVGGAGGVQECNCFEMCALVVACVR